MARAARRDLQSLAQAPHPLLLPYRLAWHVKCNTPSARDRDEYPHRVEGMRQQSKGRMAIQGSVLIVDGNPQMTAMLQRFLSRQQVAALAVSSPAEARLLLAQDACRVVVTDCFGPSNEGWDLLRYVRQAFPTTRVILMTAFGAPDLHRHALAEGAYACLAKPFRLREFGDVMQAALQGFPASEARGGSGAGGLRQQSRDRRPIINPGCESTAT